MRRTVCLALVFLLLFSFSGCTWNNEDSDTVTFYYRRAAFSHGAEDSVIAPETRDISGHVGDLSYLLALYLIGPMDDTLISPFSKSTRILSAEQTKDGVRVELSGVRESVSDSDFTLACACLTLTCLEICDASEVTIVSGERTVTMTRGSLLLSDSSTAEETTNGG